VCLAEKKAKSISPARTRVPVVFTEFLRTHQIESRLEPDDASTRRSESHWRAACAAEATRPGGHGAGAARRKASQLRSPVKCSALYCLGSCAPARSLRAPQGSLFSSSASLTLNAADAGRQSTFLQVTRTHKTDSAAFLFWTRGTQKISTLDFWHFLF